MGKQSTRLGFCDKCHRARLWTAELIVENQNGKERVGRDHKVKCCLVVGGTGSVQPGEVKSHRNTATLDDHFLKRVGACARRFLSELGCVVFGVIPEKQQ